MFSRRDHYILLSTVEHFNMGNRTFSDGTLRLSWGKLGRTCSKQRSILSTFRFFFKQQLRNDGTWVISIDWMLAICWPFGLTWSPRNVAWVIHLLPTSRTTWHLNERINWRKCIDHVLLHITSRRAVSVSLSDATKLIRSSTRVPIINAVEFQTPLLLFLIINCNFTFFNIKSDYSLRLLSEAKIVFLQKDFELIFRVDHYFSTVQGSLFLWRFLLHFFWCSIYWIFAWETDLIMLP